MSYVARKTTVDPNTGVQFYELSESKEAKDFNTGTTVTIRSTVYSNITRTQLTDSSSSLQASIDDINLQIAAIDAA